MPGMFLIPPEALYTATSLRFLFLLCASMSPQQLLPRQYVCASTCSPVINYHNYIVLQAYWAVSEPLICVSLELL